ncbi:hypothetical protein Pres01_07020 [Metapseudomonas resinovorans]|nr:hypothetical protein Pres01_07020 [Pseudomonas resinovorans]
MIETTAPARPARCEVYQKAAGRTLREMVPGAEWKLEATGKAKDQTQRAIGNSDSFTQ